MSAGRGLWAVVPVKLFARTKRRLMPLLSGEEREALARAMLADVLAALARAHSLAGIMVITGDAAAAALARTAGASVLADAENAGTTAAVTQAAKYLAGLGRDGMLVIPADVPLITPADVEQITAAHRAAPAVTLVPASMDGGTNAFVCSPPAAVPACFGEHSLRRHQDASRACGIEPQILPLEHLGHDIDRPSDLATFLAGASPTQSYAYLAAQGIAQRLQSLQRGRHNRASLSPRERERG